MTLAAPRSRQGKVSLVLAILVAFVAVAGSVFWYTSDASAQLPLTTAMEADQDPNGPGTVTFGDTVEYTATATLTAPLPNAADVLIIDVFFGGAFPGNLANVTGSCSGAGVFGPNGFGDGYSCVWPAAVLAGTYNFQMEGQATTDLAPPSFQVCAQGGGGDCASASGNDVQNIPDGNGDLGTLTADASNLVGVEGDATTNPLGAPHTFILTLAPNVNCANGDPDNPGFTGDDSTPHDDAIDCSDAADVTINCANGTAGIDAVVSSGAVDGTGQVQIDISQTVFEEDDCTVTVNFLAADDDCDQLPPVPIIEGVGTQGQPVPCIDDIPFSIALTKSYAVLDGHLRHLDIPDAATEDAADDDDQDPIDEFCDSIVSAGVAGGNGSELDTCGLLEGQDDWDDATGSFHGACIVALPFEGNALFVDWQIVAVSGSPLPTPVSITEFEGPDGILCVRWSTGFTGTQNITATYDNGIGPVITYYWDGYCVEGADCVSSPPNGDPVPLPLVKEWNDIDETKPVLVDGVVGETLFNNTDDLADWDQRDCSFIPAAPSVSDLGFCDDTNWDGLTVQEEAAYILNTPLGINVAAGPVSFIDYTFGNHSDAGGIYDGPIDGAEQTYSVSGDCGSVILENPTTGDSIVLQPGESETVLNSDKGVGFTFVPTDDGSLQVTLDNADCGPLAQICVDIETVEDNLFRSPPIDDAEDESVCVEYTVGPPGDKTPILAWAGQRVLLEHYWGNSDGSCFDQDQGEDSDQFGVLYAKQNGPGSFTGALQSNGDNDIDQTTDAALVNVDIEPDDDEDDGVVDANSGCISRIVYESEDEGQVDVSAFIVDDDDELDDADPRSQQVAFVIYYMKFEDLELGIVPGGRAGHNSGDFAPANPIDPSSDVTQEESNVSADVLVRARVRGWVETTNCPARESGVGSNGEFLPANRCIFPDDWRFKAGGNLAEETRPNFDVLNTPPTPPLPGQNNCSSDPRAAGPFSLLDTNVQGDTSAVVCGDSLAPNVSAGHPCLYAIGYSCRETVFPNGIIDMYDANMPPALLTFQLSGSGFLHGADKDSIYTGNSNLFYATHVPAEPYIGPINQDLSGYSWNSWGGPGAKSGQYDYWDDLADFGTPITSCPGASPCGAGVVTGGYALTRVYTDNHGEAMTWVNGDANLTYVDCDTSAGTAGNNIVLLNGFYCEEGEEVGDSTISSYVDYPDKRKHFAIESNDVSITWTWGGIKFVTVEPGESAQFNYVVLHLTDRDGYCDPSPSLHPVIGEQVEFTIDSPNGIIFPDANGNAAALLGSYTPKTADVTTFDTDGANSALTITPVIKDGECQAWIHVSESLLEPVNVIITAYDPEGTVTFDVVINEPVTPTPPATPTPTPANQTELWADIDCSDSVDPVDSLKVLRENAGMSVSQGADCPESGAELLVQWNVGEASEEAWGDADCDGSITAIDSLKILRFDAGLFYLNQQPCPDISEEVLVPAQ